MAERFDYWHECLAKAVAPMEISSDRTSEFRAEMRLLQCGAARVWPIATQPARFLRTPRLIRRSDPEFYHLSLPLHGRLGIAQAGRETDIGPHEMFVIDTSQPYDLRVHQRPNAGVGLEVPKASLPFSPERVRPLLAQRLPGREGVGALLAGLLARMAEDAASYRPSDGLRLETVLTDLFSATLAHHLDAAAHLLPETRNRALVTRVRAFVRQHLHDPELTPTAIAAAHHISVGHLHRLFTAEGSTVASWIRRQRLERVRRDLADPSLRAEPIHRIAARWGFPNPAVFTRTFRAAYGTPPRSYRNQALSGASENPREHASSRNR